MTEPLTAAQRDAIGWGGREGMSDAGSQFHYFRQSADHRILWGGYDAIYHPGNAVKPSHDQRPATFDLLARQFVETFPQLDGIRFTHRWGGAIDTSTRFSVTFGETLGGRVHYALGYTGLGVGATRWAAGVLRDMVLDPGVGRPADAVRPLAPVPDPARARANARGGAHAPVGHRLRHERGTPRAVPPGDGRAGDRLRLLAPAVALALARLGVAHTSRVAVASTVIEQRLAHAQRTHSRRTVRAPSAPGRRSPGPTSGHSPLPAGPQQSLRDDRPVRRSSKDLQVRRRGRRGPRRSGALRAQAEGLTQPGSSAASVTSGSEPCPMSWSWNPVRSKRSPSRASSSWRSRRISRIPTM